MYAPQHGQIATPIGFVTMIATDEWLISVQIGRRPVRPSPPSPLVREGLAQIAAWFAGRLTDFTLPLAPASSSRGQALRAALIAVPYGQTISYGALAALAGSGARAIGQLCARNPLPLLVPCHRVTAAGGKLGAYSAADGPESKAWLIAHEARLQSMITLAAPAP